ncbi:MAG: methyltransferase type 11 [Desulfovibrionaceae bacterium CG1_02_65_16]|nr:MAG: methyltransferase type 11 [Desulfovibrionaceae bacterium CG1_02_65_16]
MNRAAYDRIASKWDEARRGLARRERDYLDLLLADAPSGALVLDAGCGTGRPMAEEVLHRGFAVHGIDQSGEMLAIARRRLPTGIWTMARLETSVFGGPFAAAICWDALFHIDRAEHAPILARLRESLAPGGRLMLTCGGSDHPAFDDEMFGERFHYDSLTPAATVATLKARGMRVLRADYLNLPTRGRDKGRFAVLAQRM